MTISVSPVVLILSLLVLVLFSSAALILFMRKQRKSEVHEQAPAGNRRRGYATVLAGAVLVAIVAGGIGYFYGRETSVKKRASVEKRGEPRIEIEYMVRESDPSRRNTFTIRGRTDPGCIIFLNGRQIPIDAAGRFLFVYDLPPGEPTALVPLAFTATSTQGVTATKVHRVGYAR